MKNMIYSLVVLISLNLVTACGEDQLDNFVAKGGGDKTSPLTVVKTEAQMIEEIKGYSLSIEDIDYLISKMSPAAQLASAAPIAAVYSAVKVSSVVTTILNLWDKLSLTGKNAVVAYFKALSLKIHQGNIRQAPIDYAYNEIVAFFLNKLNLRQEHRVAGIILEQESFEKLGKFEAQEGVQKFLEMYKALPSSSQYKVDEFLQKWVKLNPREIVKGEEEHAPIEEVKEIKGTELEDIAHDTNGGVQPVRDIEGEQAAQASANDTKNDAVQVINDTATIQDVQPANDVVQPVKVIKVEQAAQASANDTIQSEAAADIQATAPIKPSKGTLTVQTAEATKASTF